MRSEFENRKFQLWEYRVSHGQLLIRSPKTSQFTENVDLKFYGVEYVSVARHLNGVTLKSIGLEEFNRLEKIIEKPISMENVFVLESNHVRHFVIAAKMMVDCNESDIFQSPF